MKIAFHLNSLEKGGAERVVVNLTADLLRRGHEIQIVNEWAGEEEFPVPEGATRLIVGLSDEEEKKGRIAKFFCKVRHLKDYLLKEKPDVLVTLGQRANYRGLMAQKGTGVPVVFCVRTVPEGNYDRFSDWVQIRWLFPRAAGAVFQTARQRAFFGRYAPEGSVIILNPVAEVYTGVEAPAEREKTVVQSARLVDFKNQPLLIRAFCRVHEKHPDYVLKIYGADSGDGTKRILEALIREKEAEEFVFLMGDSDELEKVLPQAAVFAFSSDWEGLPNSLVEAMVMGLPVVATDCPCGGPAELIRHEENGLLVPIGDEDAMTAGICRLIEDKELAKRLGTEARKLTERTRASVIGDQWEAYLRQVIADWQKRRA